MSRFIAEAGHELRGPLAVLRAELELATRPGRSKTELIQAITNAAEETRRLTRLTENLLLLARHDENTLLAQPRLLPIAPILHAAAQHARRTTTALRIEAPPDLIAVIDPGRLRQALDNLLGNALRATPADGQITARAFPRYDTLVIEIVDSGPGFPDDFLPSLLSDSAASTTPAPATRAEQGWDWRSSKPSSKHTAITSEPSTSR